MSINRSCNNVLSISKTTIFPANRSLIIAIQLFCFQSKPPSSFALVKYCIETPCEELLQTLPCSYLPMPSRACFYFVYIQFSLPAFLRPFCTCQSECRYLLHNLVEILCVRKIVF